MWIGGPYFLMAILLLLYALLDALFPCVLSLADTTTASPYHAETTFTDGLGGSFSFSGLIGPSWINGVIVALVLGAAAQRAMIIACAVLGLGRWNLRFGAALVSSALLYAVLQVRLGAPFGSWEDAATPYLAMPLEFLSLAAPLAVSAVCSGPLTNPPPIH